MDYGFQETSGCEVPVSKKFCFCFESFVINMSRQNADTKQKSTSFRFFSSKNASISEKSTIFAVANQMVGVAQLVRVPDCGSVGRGFESHLPPR